MAPQKRPHCANAFHFQRSAIAPVGIVATVSRPGLRGGSKENSRFNASRNAGLGFSTASSAEDHLQALARKGALEILPGASRGLRLKDLPGMPVQGTLPLVGRVAAGSPILAAEHIEARYKIDADLFAPRADYLLRVRGMSMKDAGILDGDLLAVHKSAEARSGQIVVARLGDDVTVKRLKRQGREIVLVAENPAFAPIVVDSRKTPFAIEGVGVGLIRGGKGL